ncbi:MAG: 4-hydroxythreonine-4-phosphate dehydrogenase PdxA [Pseudomonadota bacterium]
MAKTPVIALTPGEPAGIGPDVCLLLASRPPRARLVCIADPVVLRNRAKALDLPFEAVAWAGQAQDGLYLLPVATKAPVVPGRLDKANAAYVLETLKRAVTGCLNGEFDALVTGPAHKGNINDAGFAFTGHTEYLAALAGGVTPVMMLAAGNLRVVLATTHLALADVPRAITRERVTRVIEILHRDLKEKFGMLEPRIRVCGLNPHAGEGGHLGREEIEVIEPVIKALIAKGMKLEGPVPADTAFLPESLKDTDAVLAMYHDQGLPVLKHHDFAHAVNITLGLPFIRTSVDHGTALELAGTGKADPSSLYAAIDMALTMIKATKKIRLG